MDHKKLKHAVAAYLERGYQPLIVAPPGVDVRKRKDSDETIPGGKSPGYYAHGEWRAASIPMAAMKKTTREIVAQADGSKHAPNIGIICGIEVEANYLAGLDFDFGDIANLKERNAKIDEIRRALGIHKSAFRRSGKGGIAPILTDVRRGTDIKVPDLGTIQLLAQNKQFVVPPSVYPGKGSYAWENVEQDGFPCDAADLPYIPFSELKERLEELGIVANRPNEDDHGTEGQIAKLLSDSRVIDAIALAHEVADDLPLYGIERVKGLVDRETYRKAEAATTLNPQLEKMLAKKKVGQDTSGSGLIMSAYRAMKDSTIAFKAHEAIAIVAAANICSKEDEAEISRELVRSWVRSTPSHDVIVKTGGEAFTSIVSDDTPVGEEYKAQKAALAYTAALNRRELEFKTKIKPRHIIAPHYTVGQFGVLVAPGGTGKSAFVIAEALAIQTGRDIMKWGRLPKKRNVCIINGEDSFEEMRRRISAAMTKHEVEDREVAGMRLVSGRDFPNGFVLLSKDGTKHVRNQPAIDAIIGFIRKHEIGVLVLDPASSIHAVLENDNGDMVALSKLLNEIADASGIAIMVVAHARKNAGTDQTTVSDTRGGSALVDGARSVRTLITMTEQQAEKEFHDKRKARRHIRVYEEGAKVNMFAVGESTVWYELASIDMENAEGEWEADNVQAVAATSTPVQADAATAALEAQEAVLTLMAEGYNRVAHNSDRWVGLAVAQALRLDRSDSKAAATIKATIKKLVRAKVIVETTEQDEKRRPRPIYRQGPNALVDAELDITSGAGDSPKSDSDLDTTVGKTGKSDSSSDEYDDMLDIPEKAENRNKSVLQYPKTTGAKTNLTRSGNGLKSVA